jgi:hypothetical protein
VYDRRDASVLLGVVVVGAAATHLLYDPPTELIRPFLFGVFLAAARFMQKKRN